MSQLEAFRNEVEAFLARSKMSPTQFGKDALGDPSFVFNLRGSRSPNLATVDKVLGFIRSKEPQSAEAAE
jgi:predicted transcriptional regulator